jgi:hypothetical protein
MARFQPGHKLAKGRPKGAKNKATLAKDFVQHWAEFEKDPEYIANRTRRILAGRAAHLETLGIKLVHPEQSNHNLTGKLVIEWES